MSNSVSASSLTSGSWVARWGAWQINVRTVGDAWHVRIWSHVDGVARVQIAKRAVLPTASDAVEWACEVLRQHGAIVFVDGREQQLEKFLAFSPVQGAASRGETTVVE
jgi:hypothetical protein